MLLKDGLAIGPYWGKSTSNTTGRDQLGMQATSIATYALLLPGLINPTKRIRYYSFYAWLIEKYATQFKGLQKPILRDFIRRGELLFAFASLKSDDKQKSLYGSKYIKNYSKKHHNLSSDRHYIDLAKSADNPRGPESYWQYSGGAFEQYYRGLLKNIGILTELKDGAIGVTDRGKELGDAFESSVKSDCVNVVLQSIIKGGIKVSDLTVICKNFNCHTIEGKESQLLINALLNPNVSLENSFRRNTIILLLDYAKSQGHIKEPLDFPKSICYGTTTLGKKVNFQNLTLTRDIWKYYILNEYTHLGFEAIFEFLLVNLKENGWTLIEDCSDKFISDVLRSVNRILPNLHHINKKTRLGNILQSLNIYCKSKWNEDGSPEWLVQQYLKEKDIAFPVLLVLSLAEKYRKEITTLKYIGTNHQIHRDGCFTEVIDDILSMQNLTFGDALHRLLCSGVIGRHLQTAYRKINQTSHTLKFIYEQDSLLWLNSSEPGWTSPRLGSLMNYLKDLSILDDNGALTSLGRSLHAKNTQR